MTPNLPILAQPLQPGWLRQCPSCQQHFALRQVRIENDPCLGEVRVYVCNHCEHEVKHAQQLPPHVV